MLSLQLTATAAQIKLWWPSGMGPQPLYNVSAMWTSAPSDANWPTATTTATTTTATAVRRMGFRVFALVTVNDTDAAYVLANASADGTGRHGMFVRVNGAAMYSRGANMVRELSPPRFYL
jgi:beta-mannosidase